MRKYLISLLFLTAVATGQAQSGYCLSFADYQSNTWHTVENLQLEYRSGNKSLWNGGATYKPVTGDAKTEKVLKKEARLLHHDSLFINCRNLSYQKTRFGNWYAPTCVFDRDYLMFVALSLKAIKQTRNSSMAFGIIGGAIAAANHQDDYQCYVFYPSSETVKPVDQEMMESLLENHPEMREAYDKTDKKKKYAPEVVIPILQQLGLIDESPYSQIRQNQ